MTESPSSIDRTSPGLLASAPLLFPAFEREGVGGRGKTRLTGSSSKKRFCGTQFEQTDQPLEALLPIGVRRTPFHCATFSSALKLSVSTCLRQKGKSTPGRAGRPVQCGAYSIRVSPRNR